NMVQRYPDSVLSRYFDAEFAIMLLQQPSKEVNQFVNQLLKGLERLTPSAPLQRENWCHIGMTYFASGERRGRIMDEADMALRSAQLQGTNSWYAFQKDVLGEDTRGSVRWRTLLDAVFSQGGPALYQQPAYLSGEQVPLHRELLARINDENGEMIKASRFLPAVEQVGFNVRMDKQVISQALDLLKNGPTLDNFAINVSIESLLDKGFIRWFRDELLQTPRPVLKRLSIEVPERNLSRHIDAVRTFLKMVTGLGCRLGVDQAGRTIVSTHYIKDVNVQYIKLHRSLIREIDQRQENQLFVRSMLGACANSGVEVIAVGVENDREWQVLQQLGINGGQGRFFAPEMSVSQMSSKKRR
ncbi:MAG: EAL domain-containing protein, partial [Photobacterium halotolerans]